MGKAEKRLARRQAEEDLRVSKRPAEVERILLQRRPHQLTDPQVKKIPAEWKPGESRLLHLVQVDLKSADRGGEWTWGARDWHPNPGNGYIDGLVADWCRVTWREIEEATVGADGKKRHVAYSMDQICDEAQKRLVDLQKDDRDEIFRFRTAGAERLYGFRVGLIFEVLWYDRWHKIYPMEDGPNYTAAKVG